MPIVKQGHFTGIGMRTKVEDKSILVINTCSGNGPVYSRPCPNCSLTRVHVAGHQDPHSWWLPTFYHSAG